MPWKQIDMTGQRFASVVALRPVGRNSSGGYVWQFACDCGAEFPGTGSEVRYGRITSCPACAIKRSKAAVTIHGLTNHELYGMWGSMKSRCLNPKADGYKDYGGRGIAVCARWAASFQAFLADMGERPSPDHSIERKDGDGDYEPGNCEWATAAVQANNKRNNRLITIDGETKTLAQWALVASITEAGIRSRLKRGMSGIDLLGDSALSLLIFNGQHRTLEEWAEVTGIKKGTLSSRLYVYGWSLERALTKRASP